MNKCDCYHIESEARWLVNGDGCAVCGTINVPRCWGTKERDVCDCGGDKSNCNFYERVRIEAAEEKKSSERKDVLDEIENLIGEFWGADPIYYTEDGIEADYAKLCCKILEAIRTVKEGETDEKDS